MNATPIPFDKWLANNDLDGHDCEECIGWGWVDCGACDGEGEILDVMCGECGGTGSVKCEYCKGTGAKEYENYELQIKKDLEFLAKLQCFSSKAKEAQGEQS